MSDTEQPMTIYLADEHTGARSLLEAVRRSSGPLLCVCTPVGLSHIDREPLKAILAQCRSLNPDRTLIMATKDKRTQEYAVAAGWQVITTVKKLRPLVMTSPQEGAALRIFSPVVWRERIRSRLQTVGILSLPKVRVWLLVGVSAAVFLYTFFRLLPTSEVRIWPSQQTQSFTMNVYFATSGAVLPVDPARVRVLPLTLLTVTVDRTITYDQVSKRFTGTNASMRITVFNDSAEPYSLRKGTRLLNQAGMVFRLEDSVDLAPHTSVLARATADPLDLYGEVLGERGNVPGMVRWEFPGLMQSERQLVYARNEEPAKGGTTSYVNVLSKEDLFGTPKQPGARQRIEQELLSIARQQVDDEITLMNRSRGTAMVELRRDDELSRIEYLDIQLPEQFIGQDMATVPVSGKLRYSVMLYDESQLLALLHKEILQRVPVGQSIIESTITRDNMNLHVLAPWDDDLQWVKLTANLTYAQRYILDSATKNGATFAKYIRDNVAGKSVDDAARIVKNLPEVSRVEIRTWPPWIGKLPDLGTSIAVTEVRE